MAPGEGGRAGRNRMGAGTCKQAYKNWHMAWGYSFDVRVAVGVHAPTPLRAYSQVGANAFLLVAAGVCIYIQVCK